RDWRSGPLPPAVFRNSCCEPGRAGVASALSAACRPDRPVRASVSRPLSVGVPLPAQRTAGENVQGPPREEDCPPGLPLRRGLPADGVGSRAAAGDAGGRVVVWDLDWRSSQVGAGIMSESTTAEDRCRGVLVGLAAGDRIGGPIRLAVRLAESLLACGGFAPA